jgi:molecular chaperone GrpE
MTASENAEPLKTTNAAAEPAASQPAPDDTPSASSGSAAPGVLPKDGTPKNGAPPPPPPAAAPPAGNPATGTPAAVGKPTAADTQPPPAVAPTGTQPSPAATQAQSAAAATTQPPPVAAQDATLTLTAELAAARKQAADNYDRYIRAAADHENFRRRALREKDEIRLYAASRVLEDLFPILEALALGINAAKAPGADSATLVNGMTLVLDQFKTALAGHGLKEIHPEGEKFDPNHHEAIATRPSAEVPEGSIIQVFRTGYALNGRVLRPAAVIVSSGEK